MPNNAVTRSKLRRSTLYYNESRHRYWCVSVIYPLQNKWRRDRYTVHFNVFRLCFGIRFLFGICCLGHGVNTVATSQIRFPDLYRQFFRIKIQKTNETSPTNCALRSNNCTNSCSESTNFPWQDKCHDFFRTFCLLPDHLWTPKKQRHSIYIAHCSGAVRHTQSRRSAKPGLTDFGLQPYVALFCCLMVSTPIIT